MNFLLTGGAGYIGSHAALSLLDAGHNVHIMMIYLLETKVLFLKMHFLQNVILMMKK